MCKTKLRSRMWALRGYIYVEINFNMIELNQNKAMKRWPGEELILKEEEEERNASFLEDP